MAKQEIAVDTVEADAAELKRQRKEARKAATAAAEAAAVTLGGETAEVDEEEAKRQRKVAKKAAREAAASEVAAVEPMEIDEEEVKRQKKAAKKAAKEAAAAAQISAALAPEVSEEEAKALRKAAKKAAKAAAAAAEEAQQPETPKKSSAKRGADEAEVDKAAAPKVKKSKSEKQSQEDKAKPGEQLPRVEGSRKSKQAESANGLTIFIRNLPWKAEESVLRKDFSECGEIEHIKMPLNEEGKPRGFAFLKFLTQEGCEAALKFDSTEYGGRTIYVIKAGENTRGKGKDGTKGKGKSAHSDRDNVLTICIKGLAYSVEEDTVRKDFTECGEIAKMNMPTNEEGKSRGMAFVTFKTQEAFDAAMKFDQTEYAGRTIMVGKPLVRGEGEKGKGKNGKDGKGKGKDGKDAKGKGKGKKGKESMSKKAKIASVPEAADDSDDEDAQ